MEARIYFRASTLPAKDLSDGEASQHMVPTDPSRKDSPMLNEFAKPIPLAQAIGNAATAYNDVPPTT